MINRLVELIEENYDKFPDIDKCPICRLRQGTIDILALYSPNHALKMVEHILEHMAKDGLLKRVIRENGEIGYEILPEVARVIKAKYTERTGIV